LLLAAAGAAWLWSALKTLPWISGGRTFCGGAARSVERSVARLLKREGVVRNAVAFEFYARRHPKRSLQAGEYFSIRRLRLMTCSGSWPTERYSNSHSQCARRNDVDIARDLEAGNFMPASDFLRAAKDAALIQDISPHATTLEGFLFLPRITCRGILLQQGLQRRW